MFKRTVFNDILKRLTEPRKFIQVLAGPRQVGKTTLSRQLMEAAGIPAHYASADEPALKSGSWLEQQWETARFKTRKDSAGNTEEALLVLDEIQKIPGWSADFPAGP